MLNYDSKQIYLLAATLLKARSSFRWNTGGIARRPSRALTRTLSVAYLGFCEGGPEPKTRGSRRLRRQWGRVWGGGVPSPLKNGSGEGAVPPPQKFLNFFLVQCVQKIFVFRPKGGGHRPVPPPLNTPLIPGSGSGGGLSGSDNVVIAACHN